MSRENPPLPPRPAPDARRRGTAGDASDREDIAHVRAFLEGDERAFERLYEKYREKVYTVAYRFVRNQEDALEVAQEVFLRVYLNLKRFKTNSRFFTWLYRITVNRAIDFTRSRKNRPFVGIDGAMLDQADAPGSREPSPSDAVEQKELEEKLEEAIESLSPKHRAVFVLHASENLSYRQIAEVLELNIGTVMSRLFYARRKLAELLAAQGFDIGGRRT